MTYGGIQKLGHEMGLTYTRPIVKAPQAAPLGQATEEPIAVDVTLRSSAVENVYSRDVHDGCTPGQRLDCYI